jgi:hypothetical protein
VRVRCALPSQRVAGIHHGRRGWRWWDTTGLWALLGTGWALGSWNAA